MTDQATPTSCLELPLSPEQVALLSPVLLLARSHDQSVIFAVATNSFMPDAGRPVARLQLKIVDKKIAARAIKLLREAKLQ